MQHAREVQTGDDEAAKVWDEGNRGEGEVGSGRDIIVAWTTGTASGGTKTEGTQSARRWWKSCLRACDGVRRSLKWELDIDECSYGLDGSGLLGMVDEVALAGLVFGEPVKDVELRVVGPRTGRGRLL